MVTLRIVPGSGQTHPLIEARMEMDDRLMTVKELAAYLNLNERTVLKLAAEGPLPAVKVGNQWRFREGKIDALVDDQMLGVRRPDVPPPPAPKPKSTTLDPRHPVNSSAAPLRSPLSLPTPPSPTLMRGGRGRAPYLTPNGGPGRKWGADAPLPESRVGKMGGSGKQGTAVWRNPKSLATAPGSVAPPRA